MERYIKEKKYLKVLYVVLAILFIIPSIRYYIQNKTILTFEKWEHYLMDDSSVDTQAICYLIMILSIAICFYFIIKNREKLFKNIKSVVIFSGIIGAIYVFAIPFTCSDVFYYLGVGRLDSQYNKNPYYTTIKEYVDNENPESIESDTVLKKGYENSWSNSTVVYGPVWQLICKVVSIFSFGNIDIGLLLFKIVNLIIHLINGYLIYKITGKKLFTLLYTLNPLLLFEGIMCVHNDIYVILFILLALYFLLKKKKLVPSVMMLAFATGIKYFAVLILPFIIIYYYRKEKILKRFLKCMQYGTIFAVTLIIPYLFYVQDMAVLQGMTTQQDKYAKSIYVFFIEFFPDFNVKELSKVIFDIFVIIYLKEFIELLCTKNINFKKCMEKYNILLFIFLFAVITQFQPWYLMWLMPTFMWLKPNALKTVVALGIISEILISIFLFISDTWRNGMVYLFFTSTITLGYTVFIQHNDKNRKINCYIKNLEKNVLNKAE